MMENTNPDQWDPVRQGGLHGPHFSTAGWDQEFKVGKAPGLHPVEMLARIAKFEVRSRPILKISFSLPQDRHKKHYFGHVPQNGSLSTQCLGQETSDPIFNIQYTYVLPKKLEICF